MAELTAILSFSHEKEHTQRGHTLSQKYANSWNKREMMKSRMPSAQECQESPEECVRPSGRGAPDAPRSWRPARGSPPARPGLPARGGRPAPSAPLSGQRPRPGQAVRVHLKRKAGSGTATPLWGSRGRYTQSGKTAPTLYSRERKLRNTQVLSESVFPVTPSPLRGPVAALPSPPFFSTPAPGAAQPLLASAAPESARGEGLPRHDRRSASLPARYQLVVQGEPCCSLLAPGRTQRP